MGKNKLDTVRAEMWEEVLLYHELRQGPETKNAQGGKNWQDEKWGKTLNRLSIYLLKERNKQRLIEELFVGDEELFLGDRHKDWTEDKEEKYLKAVNEVFPKINEYYRFPQPHDLECLGEKLHLILAQHSRKHKTMEELIRDYGKAGQIVKKAFDGYLFKDHHGKEEWIPDKMVPESFHWPIDKILADPDPSEGRPFKADDCVRLMTDEYWGMPQGIEGYVSGVVSNKFLGWEGNFCQVMFIVACTDETTEQDEIMVWTDFLEVKEDELQLCDKDHPPSLWFPYQVAKNGEVIKDPKSGSFNYHKKIKPYTFDQLWEVLNAQRGESLQQEGEEDLSSLLGVERTSVQTREKPFERGWNRIKSLWKEGTEGVRNANRNISKKLKQIIR